MLGPMGHGRKGNLKLRGHYVGGFENEFAFMHCKPHDEAEIPTVRIAQCQNGNNAWEAKNV